MLWSHKFISAGVVAAAPAPNVLRALIGLFKTKKTTKNSCPNNFDMAANSITVQNVGALLTTITFSTVKFIMR